MKFPFVSRTRHEAELRGLKDKIIKAEEKGKKAGDKLARISARHDAEQQRANELEKLCWGRLREIEDLRSAVSELRRSRMRLLDEASRARLAAAPYQGPAIPVMVGMDVEPDARVVDLKDPSWRSTVELFKKVAHLRKELSATAGGAPVRFTWFPRADPQVEKANGCATWALEYFVKEWQAVRAEGDEIGLHMHPWRWDEKAGGWCQDHADESWVLSCVHASIAAFRKVFGKTPACYRGGDRYLSNAVVRALEEEGVLVDLTLERMPEAPRLVESERGTGVIPDGTFVPLRAYRPSSKDFRVPDSAKRTGFGMLPLTPHEHGTLKPWLPNTVFEEALDELLERAGSDAPESPTHLAFIIRSDLAASPLWEDFAENALSLARRAREGRLLFATASEAWRLATRS